MKIQKFIWKTHGVSGSYTKNFVMDRQLTKSMKNSIVKVFNDIGVGTNEMAEAVELPYHYSLDIFKKKKLRRRKRMFSYETEDQPLYQCSL